MDLYLSINILEENNSLRNNEEVDPFFQVCFSSLLDKKRTIWSIDLNNLRDKTKANNSVLVIKSNNASEKLPFHSGVSFSLFTKLLISKYHRYEPIGGGFIYLKELIEKKKIILQIIDYSQVDTKFTRMVIQVNLVKIVGEIPLFEKSLDHNVVLKKIIDRYNETVNKKLKPTKKDLKIMHIRSHFPNVSGIKSPASTFSIYTNPVCDPLFLEYHVKIACDMNGWNENELIEVLMNQFNSETYNSFFTIASRIICEGLCLFANACDYVPDMSFKSDVERFIDSFQCLAGDCEGN